MARSRSANHDSDLSLPPWERANVVQVPYFDSASPSLSNAERDALPSLWAVQTSHPPKARPNFDSHTRYGSNSSQRRGPSEDCINSWGVKTPLTAPFPPRPYESPVYIPPAPKSTPNPPTFTRPPPTPPDSDNTDLESFRTTSTSESSRPAKREVKPLPQIPTYVQPIRSCHPQKASSARQSRKPGSRLQRWKSAFKEMFAREPEDESDLVHISAQGHWTDE